MEDERECGFLCFVQAEHFGHEDRAEIGDRGTNWRSIADATERKEFRWEGLRLPVLTLSEGALGELIGCRARFKQACEIALDVRDEARDARR